jgi:metalloendopeptidase OMA1, mitochondrial
VHRVVSRILDANDLGKLRGDPRTLRAPARTVLQPSRGFGSNGDGEEGPPDLWDPDANATGWRSGAQGAGKEWNLLVVNDEKIVNAMAAPGMQAHQCIRPLDVHVI